MGRLGRGALFGWAVLLALTAAPARADDARPDDFRRGLTAYNRAEYGESVRLWRPLAEHGNPDAQAGLAYLYYHGLGVRQDYGAAADWFQQAAEQGQPDAQLFLGTLFYNGIGVGQSYVQAFKWCDLAQSNGASQAGPCREAAQQRMSDPELEESTRLVVEWFRRHPR
ncbi:MAG TPA: tetratricopeptide repeat protein [Alphaproteobacteria bacterium]|nr:tetratricopeptide repeat protein [Alphaproteobacteria bacterium]